MANGTLDPTLSALSTLLEQTPTRAGWLEVCAVLEALAGSPELLDQALDRVAAADWPTALRMAPLLWINRLVTGRLPVQALRAVSCLHLLPALYDSVMPPEALMNWLESLPEDAPALDGICLSSRTTHVQAIDAAVADEADTSLHPSPRAFIPSRHDHYNREVLFAVLRSPIARALKVFDISVDSTIEEEAEVEQLFYLQGRNPDMSLDELLALNPGTRGDMEEAWKSFCNYGFDLSLLFVELPAQTLEVLDLHGHPRGLGATLGRSQEPVDLPALRHLNVGGGKTWAERDLERLSGWIAHSPLESIDLAQDESFWNLEEYASDSDREYEQGCRDLSEDWYEEGLKRAEALLQALAGRAHPPAVTVTPGVGRPIGKRMARKLSLQTRTDRKPQQWRASLPSDWTAHYEM